MTRLSTAALLALYLIATTASAQQSKMQNISSNGIIDDNVPHIACTILQNPIVVVVFAEATTANSDPEVLVSTLPISEDNTIASNDDFGALSAGLRAEIRALVGRAPNRDTDAVAVVTKESFGLTAVCAVAADAVAGNGPGTVNLQLNDVTDNLARMSSGRRAATLQALAGRIDPAVVEDVLRQYRNSPFSSE